MTRKRYIKLMMSYGVPRNHAGRLAEYARNTYVSYQDAMRQYWASREMPEPALRIFEELGFSCTPGGNAVRVMLRFIG